MAFFRRQPKSNALLAAALPLVNVTVRDRAEMPKYSEWQDEAWAMFDNLGEFRQGVTWLGNVLSRARLVAAYAPEQPGDEPELISPDTNDPALDLVANIANGIGGQSELLRSATVHLTVPGVGWFVAGVADNPAASWKFYSADEVKRRQTNVGGNGSSRDVMQVRGEDGQWVDLSDDTLPIKVWRPHDRHHWQADSSTRAALPIMRRLELLNRRVDAQTQSRLASNGLYWVPSEIMFPANPNLPEGSDPFMHDFMQMGVTAIKTPGSAAAALPGVVRAPGDRIQQIRYDEFGSHDDADLQAKRELEIRRLATAIDVPPEVLLGIAGVNHWGAWQMEESSLKTTVTSLLELICWSLTCGYLQPALDASYAQDHTLAAETGLPDDRMQPDERRRIIWYDLSELTVRPDRSQAAMTLHDDMVISDDALLRETGFSDTDKLTDDSELRRRIGMKLIHSPASVEVGLELLGIGVQSPVQLPPTKIQSSAPTEEGAPTPPLNPGAPAPPPPDSGNTPSTRDKAPTPPPAAAPRPVRQG